MKTKFLALMLLATSLTPALADDYFREGISAPSIERCAIRLAFTKIRQRGLNGAIRLTGKVDKSETNRALPNHTLKRFNEGHIGLIFVDFEGEAGEQAVTGSIAVYAQKQRQDVLCKLGTHNQLPVRGQRRFILKDRQTGNEID